MTKINDYSELIIPVCKLLEKKMRTVDIIKELHLEDYNYDRIRMFIGNIKNHKNYTEISKDFNF